MSIPVKSIKTDKVFEGGHLSVIKERLEFQDGRSTDFITVKHPGAVVILPILESGPLLLVDQYRHAQGRFLLEFPAGTLNPAENTLECAKRELTEEVFYQGEEWIDLGILAPAPGFCSEVQHCFIARKLSPFKGTRDLDEIISVKTMPVNEVEDRINDGTIIDSKSISIFFRARLRGYI